jgi:hypothetical protein
MQITGEEPDLRFLAETFTGSDLKVSEEGEIYVISSERFEGLDDANAVKDVGLIMAAILNGVCRLARNGTEPIVIGNALYQDEAGGLHYHVLPEVGEIRLRGVPATLTAMLNGDGDHTSPEPVKTWALLALRDPEVAKVLRINAVAPLDWVNLYRILEIISKDVGGLKVIVSRKWMPQRSVSLFKRTANSADVLGLEARHGIQNDKAPSNPMTITEARKLVRILTWHWLQSKC